MIWNSNSTNKNLDYDKMKNDTNIEEAECDTLIEKYDNNKAERFS